MSSLQEEQGAAGEGPVGHPEDLGLGQLSDEETLQSWARSVWRRGG